METSLIARNWTQLAYWSAARSVHAMTELGTLCIRLPPPPPTLPPRLSLPSLQ